MYFVLRTIDKNTFTVCSKHRNVMKSIFSANECKKDGGGDHWVVKMSRKQDYFHKTNNDS